MKVWIMPGDKEEWCGRVQHCSSVFKLHYITDPLSPPHTICHSLLPFFRFVHTRLFHRQLLDSTVLIAYTIQSI